MHFFFESETVASRYEGFNLSARARKNSVITAPTAKSELIFGFSDIKIGGGGVLVYPCRSPGGPALTPPQKGYPHSWCSFSEVSGGEKKAAGPKLKSLWLYILLACSSSLDAG